MLYLWDVKTKKFRYKDKDITLQIPQFHQGACGLGFESHLSGNRAFIRGRRHFQLGIRLLWLELWLFIDWRDLEFEAAMKRARDKVLTPNEIRSKL